MTDVRYLWFAPNVGLWPAFQLEHRLANALSHAGRSVTMLHCRGVLDSYCPVMASERLAATSARSARKRVCRDCIHSAEATGRLAGYSTTFLDDYVTEADRESAREFAATVTPQNWRHAEVEGYRLGRWAGYLTMLHHKLPDVAASEEAWIEYISDVEDSALVLSAMPTVFERFQPTHAVVYNPLYPTNRVFAEYARRAGAQLVGVAVGSYIPGRYDSAGVYPHLMSSQTTTDSSAIESSLASPSTPVEVRAVGAHLRELITGSDPWVYSSAPGRLAPAEVRRRLGVRPDSRVVVALVSSPDETRSSMLVEAEYLRASDGEYSDVPEFIAMTLEAARLLPGIDVVFRLHPRLMPNKRENVTSPDLERIIRLLDDLPPNARINVPEDELSLYDLIAIADAAVNQSSSAGLEFLTLGLPVVQYDPPRLGAYPRRFAHLVPRHDARALADAIERAVQAGWSLENSLSAFRWYTAVMLRALLHLKDVAITYADPVSGQDPGPAANAGVGGRSSIPLRAARTLVPASIRERVARRQARGARTASLPDPTEKETWLDEWLLRIDAATGDAPVWEPPIVQRGVGAAGQEAAAVEREVVRLLDFLGITNAAGLGAIRSALDLRATTTGGTDAGGQDP